MLAPDAFFGMGLKAGLIASRAGTNSTLFEDGDMARIAAKVSKVLLSPLQGGARGCPPENGCQTGICTWSAIQKVPII